MPQEIHRAAPRRGGGGRRGSPTVAIDLPEDDYRISVQGFDFVRDEAGELQKLLFRFELHAGKAMTVFPVAVSDIDPDSLDANYRKGVIALYSVLSMFAEKARRMEGLPKLSFISPSS
jgi:hypothetical protein